jgi:RNA polymerase sigma-54 factor
MNSPALRIEHRQHQTLTPRLQHAVRLLQLSSLDFAQEVQDALGKNPFLEADETPPETPASPEEAGVASLVVPETAVAENQPAPETEPDRDNAWERDSWQQSSASAHAGSGDSETSAMEMVAADIGLRQHLHGQVNVLPLSDRDRALVGAVIESLDDDGYLRLGLGEIAALTELRPRPDACETSTALKLVQSFEPLGVGARSVAECLLLQLQRLAPEHRELAECILNEHLERLAQHDTAGIARLTHRDPDDVEHACRAIRRLDPHPGWRYDRSEIHFATPDVIARKVRGQWIVQLNPAVVPKVRLNHTYAEMFQRHRDSKHAELASHLQEARWAMRNVEQRFSTILSVARAILRRQYRFLEYGAFAMKPMGLREIADEVGVHESTVCRVTNNKYMATPAGVYELKHFFSRAMPMASGGACSATAIRGVMQELIAAEDPACPLSDVDIAQRLSRQGLTVARRTVTKYRQQLKLPAVERRRRLAAEPPDSAAHPNGS